MSGKCFNISGITPCGCYGDVYKRYDIIICVMTWAYVVIPHNPKKKAWKGYESNLTIWEIMIYESNEHDYNQEDTCEGSDAFRSFFRLT